MAQAHAEHHDANVYYVPHGSRWPVIASVALFITMFGFASWLNESSVGKPMFFGGLVFLALILFKWFADVITESLRGYYNKQVDTSFRMGMVWFIFSEVMFFAAFFGALFYARQFAMPWLGGEGDGVMTNNLLWSGFSAAWPSNGPGAIGGSYETIPAWGLPLLNTLILLSSGVTVTIAHHALKAGRRAQLLVFLGLTVLLGALFLFFQAEEYIHAYTELNLTLGSGIYGSTFFMLTGFHGAHVTLGTIMLAIIWLRCLKGHFNKDDHFAFEAVAWYWHFVDVVWLGLFLFVYVL
jgi:cytochrome c oxidase subunit 3